MAVTTITSSGVMVATALVMDQRAECAWRDLGPNTLGGIKPMSRMAYKPGPSVAVSDELLFG